MDGALMRVRPIMMTVAAIIAGLLPIMLGGGTGSEVMRRIAAPMVGGMVSATILTLAVIPAVFLLWQEFRLSRLKKRALIPLILFGLSRFFLNSSIGNSKKFGKRCKLLV